MGKDDCVTKAIGAEEGVGCDSGGGGRHAFMLSCMNCDWMTPVVVRANSIPIGIILDDRDEVADEI